MNIQEFKLGLRNELVRKVGVLPNHILDVIYRVEPEDDYLQLCLQINSWISGPTVRPDLEDEEGIRTFVKEAGITSVQSLLDICPPGK